MSAPPHPIDIFVVSESSRNLLNLSELLSRVLNGQGQRIPFSGRNFDSDSDDFARAAWLGLVRARGCIVMRNAFSPSSEQISRSTFQNEDDADWDAGMEDDVGSLLEKKARRRRLAWRLSDLVLKSVVDQK